MIDLICELCQDSSKDSRALTSGSLVDRFCTLLVETLKRSNCSCPVSSTCVSLDCFLFTFSHLSLLYIGFTAISANNSFLRQSSKLEKEYFATFFCTFSLTDTF